MHKRLFPLGSGRFVFSTNICSFAFETGISEDVPLKYLKALLTFVFLVFQTSHLCKITSEDNGNEDATCLYVLPCPGWDNRGIGASHIGRGLLRCLIPGSEGSAKAWKPMETKQSVDSCAFLYHDGSWESALTLALVLCTSEILYGSVLRRTATPSHGLPVRYAAHAHMPIRFSPRKTSTPSCCAASRVYSITTFLPTYPRHCATRSEMACRQLRYGSVSHVDTTFCTNK